MSRGNRVRGGYWVHRRVAVYTEHRNDPSVWVKIYEERSLEKARVTAKGWTDQTGRVCKLVRVNRQEFAPPAIPTTEIDSVSVGSTQPEATKGEQR